MPTWKGIKFPYQRGKEGIPAAEVDEELVNQDLLILLKTRRKSRVMYPDLGCGLEALVFENTGPLLEAKITREVAGTIAKYEPRVTITQLYVTEESTQVNIEMEYVVNGIPKSLSFTVQR